MLRIDGVRGTEVTFEMYIPMQQVRMLMVENDRFYVIADIGVSCTIGGIVLAPISKLRVAPDQSEKVDRMVNDIGHPLWDVLHELRFNPQFGSQLEVIQERFKKRIKTQEEGS